ncbi:MAG: hypothetical protein JXM79_00985 [Sedimentisphaerales bacterium]|nr:hypothetical protein [Sedimentisphaerales bacterium]
MSGKVTCLVSLILVICSVGNAARIEWSGAGADNLWSTRNNWSPAKIPTTADEVYIDVPYAKAPNGPVIQEGIDAKALGLGCEVRGEPNMVMTGGTLEITDWVWWGDGDGCHGTLYLSGGTITVTNEFELGWGGGSGTMYMTGGTVTAGELVIPTASGLAGELFLHGGTFNVGSDGLEINTVGYMDVGGGTLIIEGDWTAKINEYIAAGLITAYDGGGLFELDYNDRNPGKTTLSAIFTGKAYNPTPADGAIIEDMWANISWSPATEAISHDVYISDNFDDVNDGTGDAFRGNQAAIYFVVGFPGFPYPDGLVPGTTYYWRIDEVKADVSVVRGDIWSFSIPPKKAYNPSPTDGAEFVDPSVLLSWTAGYGAKLHTVYLGDDYDTVNGATGGSPQGTAAYQPATALDLEKVYYWRVDEFDAVDTYKGDIWSFTTPGAVGNPSPANGAEDVKMIATLSWTASTSAASHEVYLGTNEEAVRNADATSPEYVGSKALGAESHDPGKLAWHTTYYWRVDEVDGQGNTQKGPLWTFTTADFISVDDFEGYTDNDAEGEAIWQSWIDGYGVAENGAQAGYLLPPYAEQTIVHGGLQSMPLVYTNDPSAAAYSEATLTLSYPRDWTENDVSALVIWFRGKSDNAAEPLYVAVANSGGAAAVVTNDDANAAQNREWTRWVVQLQALSDQGINLTNVNTISVGLGTKGVMTTAGGTGTVYFDDIALY